VENPATCSGSNRQYPEWYEKNIPSYKFTGWFHFLIGWEPSAIAADFLCPG
jgi:hypothetical protein